MDIYRSIAIVLFILVLFSSQAKANEDCNDQPNTGDMYDCFDKQLRASETRLGKLYKKMIASIPREYRDRLKKSQTTWRAYRDAQCTFIFAAEDSRREIPCQLEMNEEREKFLTAQMEAECNGCIIYNK